MRFGRCTAYPRLELLFVACVTATASPDCIRTSPPICHPEIFQPAGDLIDPARREHPRNVALDTSFSSCRLKASAAPVVVSSRTREDGLREHAGGVVHQLRKGVRGSQVRPRERRFSSLRLQRVVVRSCPHCRGKAPRW